MDKYRLDNLNSVTNVDITMEEFWFYKLLFLLAVNACHNNTSLLNIRL